MKFLLIGASRNIGYYAALRLLSQGHTCIFLLRNPSTFDNDNTIQEYVKSGIAKLVKGDATVEEQVRNVWRVALEDGKGVDTILFTLGASSGTFSIIKGFQISPANLVTASILNVLRTYPASTPQPHLIAITSTGTTRLSHSQLPLAYKPLYSWLLPQPHKDKLGVERVISYSAGWPWDEKRDVLGEEILSQDWEGDLPSPGWLRDVVIVQPAILTDGGCRAEERGEPHGTRAGEVLKGAYTVSRKDVAWWIVEKCLKDWEAWKNKRVVLAY